MSRIRTNAGWFLPGFAVDRRDRVGGVATAVRQPQPPKTDPPTPASLAQPTAPDFATLIER